MGQPVLRKRKWKQRPPLSLLNEINKKEGLESNTSWLPCHTVPGHFLFIAGGSHDPLKKKPQKTRSIHYALPREHFVRNQDIREWEAGVEAQPQVKTCQEARQSRKKTAGMQRPKGSAVRLLWILVVQYGVPKLNFIARR